MSKQEDQASLQRKLLIEEVGFLEEQYAERHNPLYVWQCIALVINHGLVFPKWVEDYLYASAGNLFAQVEIVDQRIKERRASTKSKQSTRRKTEHTGDIVSAALGFAKNDGVGYSNAFTDFVLMDRAILSSLLVSREMYDIKGLGHTNACAVIAEKLNVPIPRVRDAYNLMVTKPTQD